MTRQGELRSRVRELTRPTDRLGHASKNPAHHSRGPTASRSQATTVIGKAYRSAIANRLAERLNMTCGRMIASKPLCEAGNRVVERPDIPEGMRKHRAALERGHDLKSSRFPFGAADPPR